MKISIICVCLNSAKTIGHTVKSFVKQNHPDKEMLIVDGLSDDETLQVVRSFGSPDIRIVSERDSGIYDAMNKGLQLYSGDAVGVLNSDDTFHDSQVLSDIAHCLSDTDVVYGNMDFVFDQVQKKVSRVWNTGSFGPRSFATGWAPPHPTFYVRREVIDFVGRFDTRYPVASDYEFMVRVLAIERFRSRYLARCLVDFQLGGASTQRSIAKLYSQNLECLRARREHLGAPFIDAAFFLKPARSLFQLRLPRRVRT
jgi:glycosyltransferase